MAESYSPCFLASLQEICRVFRVGKERVFEWISSGAPICVEGEGQRRRYSCEAMRLQLWREQRERA